MTFSAIHRSALASAAGLVLLSACSGERTTDPAMTEATVTATTGAVSAELPLDAYLGDLVSLEETDVVTRQTAVEEAIAQCMSDEGFEYTVPDVAAMYSDAIHGSPEEVETREWISTNGYGITERAGTTPVEDLEDPNGDYYRTLSGPSAAAYTEALHGPTIDGLTEAEIAAVPLQDQGCTGRAQQGEAPSDLWGQPEFESLKEAYGSMVRTTEDSVGVAEADAAWSGCMADAGYPGLTVPADAIASVHAAQEKVWAAVDVSSEPAARAAPEVRAELNDLEVATALADFTCKEETGYDEAVREVRVAAEEQFIIDYEAELDALIATYEQAVHEQ